MERLINSLFIEGECHFDELVFVRTTDDGPMLTDGAFSWHLMEHTVPIIFGDYRCPHQFEMNGKPYIGDFAAARNACFELASGQWRMFLDADDALVWEGPNEDKAPSMTKAVRGFAKGPERFNQISLNYKYSREATISHDRICVWKWQDDEGHNLWKWTGPLHELVEASAWNRGSRLQVITSRDGSWVIEHHGSPEESNERNHEIINLADQRTVSPEERLRLDASLVPSLLASEDPVLVEQGENLAMEIWDRWPNTSHGAIVAQDLIIYLTSKGLFKQAEDIAFRLVDLNPLSADAHLAMAELKRIRGDEGGALTFYSKCYLELINLPSFEYRKVGFNLDYAGRYQAAQVAEKLDRWDLALRFLEGVPETYHNDAYDYFCREAVRGLHLKQAAKGFLDYVYYLLGFDRVIDAEKIVETAPTMLRVRSEYKQARDAVYIRKFPIRDPMAEYDLINGGDIGLEFGRFHQRVLLEKIIEQHPDHYIDFGCNTGWSCVMVAKNLPGCTVEGYDVSPKRAEWARHRAKTNKVEHCDFNVVNLDQPWPISLTQKDRPGKLVVSSSETLEHMANPSAFVGRVIKLFQDKGEGCLLITVPDIERYQFVYKNCGKIDGAIERYREREHVNCFGVHELVRLFPDSRERVTVEPVHEADHGQDALLLLTWNPRDRIEVVSRPFRVDILADGFVDWGARAHLIGHAGGSEQAVIHLTPELSKLGCQVRVWGNPIDREAYVEGVEWRHFDSFDLREDRDAIVVWRRVDLIVGSRGETNDKYPVFFWGHDVPDRSLAENYQIADVVWALSPYHEMLFKDLGCETVDVLQNGVIPENIESALNSAGERHPHRMIFGSSADRGLLHLLRMWPQLRAEVPDAEIHVCYRRDLLRFPGAKSGHARVADAIEQLLFRYKDEGVIDHGGMKHQEFLELAATCSVWPYPATFDEISCIVAMEMQGLGVHPVCTDRAALKDTVIWGDMMNHKLFDEELCQGGRAGQDSHGIWFSFEGACSPSYLSLLVNRLSNPVSDQEREDARQTILQRYDWKHTAELFYESLTKDRG